MTLEEILQLVQQGLSEEEAANLFRQWGEELSFEEANDQLETFFRESGTEVSQDQRGTLVRAFQESEVGSPSLLENVRDFISVGLAGLGIGAAGAVTKGAGAVAGAVGKRAAGPQISYLAGSPAAKAGVTGAGALQETIRTTGAGSAVGKGVAAAVTSITNSHVLSRIGQSMIQFMMKHPKVAAGVAGAGALGAVGVNQGLIGGATPGAPGTPGAPSSAVQITPSEARGTPLTRRADSQLVEPGMQMPSAPAGFNVMVVDHSGQLTGTPGALAILSPEQLDLNPNMNPGQVASLANQIDGSVDYLENFSQFLSQSPNALQGTGPKVYQALFPETVGDVQITTPTQVGRSLKDRYGYTPPTPVSAGEATQPGQTGKLIPTLPEEARVSNRRETLNKTVEVPAGAQLTPRAFDTYNGRTLVEWASYYARVHGVPLNLLYGVVAHESGWNPNAVGDNGQSHGLAQIYQPTWGDQISVAQSKNPAFALSWTAKMLAERFKQYGRWDAAVAAHNSPVAANYLAETGKFQNEKSARYVNDIMNRANRSGLSSDMFSEGEDIEIAGSGPSGPQVSPFEAPDPAASRAYVRGVWQEMLGREPTESEFAREVERVNALARQSYESQVRAALGSETTQVDVGAQYEEGIRQMGEFGFHEDVQETRSFTNHTAGIARLLQQGL